MLRVCIALFFVFFLTACSSEKALEEWELEVQDRPISIAYIGATPNIEMEGVSFKSYLEVEEYEGLWIDGSEFGNLSSKEAMADIKEILNEGKVVVFLTEENAYDSIAPELGIKGYEESKGGSAVQQGFYLWDENGEVRIGFVLGDKGTNSLAIFLEHTIKNSRNLHK